MGARELLHELAGAGFSVEAEGDKLVIRPASRLTDELRAALREAKPELLALLRGEDAPPIRARAREAPPELYAPARDAMHRLGYAGAEAEAQLQAVLETVSADTVAADLQSIGDESGLPPVADPAPEMHAERLKHRGLPSAVIASLASKLAQRDRDGVDLRSCAECASFGRIGSSRGVAWFCQHPSGAIKHGCHGPDVLFRCDGFLGCR